MVGQHVLDRLPRRAARRVVRHDRRDVPVLLPAQQLRAVQVDDPALPHQPRVDFRPRQLGAERQDKGVVNAARRDLGEGGVDVVGGVALLLQADVGQCRILRHHGLRDGIVQVGALAARNLDDGQLGAGLQVDAVARVEGDGAVPVHGHGHQLHRARVHPGGDVQLHAVLGQHRVQGHHRGVQVRQAAEAGMVGEGRDGHAVRQDGRARLVAAIHQHQARARGCPRPSPEWTTPRPAALGTPFPPGRAGWCSARPRPWCRAGRPCRTGPPPRRAGRGRRAGARAGRGSAAGRRRHRCGATGSCRALHAGGCASRLADDPAVAVRLQLARQLRPAGADDAPG